MPCDINNPLRKPPRYSDLHVSQTLPKTNKLNKVSPENLGTGPPCTQIPTAFQRIVELFRLEKIFKEN